MGFDRADIKPYIVGEFPDAISKHASSKTLSEAVYCGKPLVWLIDGAQRLESGLMGLTGDTPGSTLFVKMISGIMTLLDLPEVEGIIMTLDDENSIPTKSIAGRSKGGPKPTTDIVVNDTECPDQHEWQLHKSKPLSRRTMYSHITAKMDGYFDWKKNKSGVQNKWIMLSNAVDLGTEHFNAPYCCKKYNFATGGIEYVTNPGLCEGELSMMWHARDLGDQYDYVCMSTDGDLIPLTVLHSKERLDASGQWKNKMHIQQKNYEKGTKLKAVCYDVNMMCDKIKNEIFTGREAWNVWFAAMIISGGDDFVRGYCRGVGFSSISKGWIKANQTFLTDSFITVSEFTERGTTVYHHNIDHGQFLMMTALIYKIGNRPKLFIGQDMTPLYVFAGNLAWNLAYWHNQILLKSDRHKLIYTGLEVCEKTQLPLFGYSPCPTNKVIKSSIIASKQVHPADLSAYNAVPFKDRVSVETKL